MNRIVSCTVLSICCLFIASLACAVSLTSKERLGKIMYQDKDFSLNSTQSCQTCHHRSAGFADPTNARDPYVTVVSLGDDGVSLGGRNAPTSAYAGYSPALYWDEAKQSWFGGMFWDGRADGSILGDPLAEQAGGPPLNPVEMNMPDKEAVVEVVRNASYANLFLQVFGPGSLDDVDDAYDNIGRAIAAYERSFEVQQFNSRYDTNDLTSAERNGKKLFQAHCDQCHTISYKPGGAKGSEAVDIFTSYGYANIGLPANDLVPLDEPDLGLGYTIDDPAQNGKFKIPTLRNVGVTAPYGHNGYFATLKSIVDFKNSGKLPEPPPPPEVAENISPFIGNMGMTETEVDELVQFLMALTDQ